MGVGSNYQASGGMNVSAGGAMVGLAVAQGLSGAYSTWQQARTSKLIAESNRRIAELKAKNALARGHEAEAISRQKTKKTIGAQRASLAAQGININQGSAYDIQAETQDIGEIDALTIKNNALREAFGYTVQATDATLQGSLAYTAGISQSMDTLLTSGLRGAKYYDDWKRGV